MAKNVKLILLEDVETLGLAGTHVTVSPGYARNYLIPLKKATQISPAAERIFAARKEKIEAKRRENVASAQAMADMIATTELVLTMEATADDSLFGSVTARVISDLMLQHGIRVPYNRILLAEPIKRIGSYQVQVKLDANIMATATIVVNKA